MNYYERIQSSIDFIEAHLSEDFTVEDAAKEAYMSVATFYRLFLSIVGFTAKEYVRLRRLSLAAEELITQKDGNVQTVTEVAYKYGYSNSDSFTRAFKKEIGENPSVFKDENYEGKKLLLQKAFKEINIMQEYFELNDSQLVKDYPDIKVLKKLPSMKVACFKYFGPDPEDHAFAKMKEWVQKNGIKLNSKTETGESAYRIFGFNNPDPSNPQDPSETYGYEVCVTIDDKLYETLPDACVYGKKESYECVMRKMLTGGKYAVVSVKRGKSGDVGEEICKAWPRFNKWLELSQFIWGQNQYLEEHLGFSDDDEHTGGVELYMPIREVKSISELLNSGKLVEEVIPSYKVACIRTQGNDFMKTAFAAWDMAITWAKKMGIEPDSKGECGCRIFMFHTDIRREQEIMITLPSNFDENQDIQIKMESSDNNIAFLPVTIEQYSGGKYMTVLTDDKNQGEVWAEMEKWRKNNKLKHQRHQWASEWILDGWNFPEKAVKVCYPI